MGVLVELASWLGTVTTSRPQFVPFSGKTVIPALLIMRSINVTLSEGGEVLAQSNGFDWGKTGCTVVNDAKQRDRIWKRKRVICAARPRAIAM